jgi:hypothetical protein
MPPETVAKETAGEETTKMRQADGQQGRSRKPRSSDTSESDDYEFYDEYLPSGDPTKSFKPAGNDYHISPVKRPAQLKERRLNTEKKCILRFK